MGAHADDGRPHGVDQVRQVLVDQSVTAEQALDLGFAAAMGDQFPSVIDAPPGRHSEKPERFAELIEGYFPSLPKIELNARRARPGWDIWGAEAPEAAQ
jgi:N6-adenosine-specific RNA methylase IME4